MAQFNIYSQIVDDKVKNSRRFKIQSRHLVIHIYYDVPDGPLDLELIINNIEETLERILNEILEDIPDNSYVRISIQNQELDFEIYLPFRQKENFNIDLVMNEILKVSQSKKEFLINGLLEINFISVDPPRIGGKILDFQSWKYKSNKVVVVKEDGLCIPRSIVVSKAYVDGLRGKEWRRIREKNGKLQTHLALRLCEDACIQPSDEGFTLESLDKFQKAIGDNYQIIAVTPPKNIIFKSKFGKKQILLIINNNHCDSLLSMCAFLKTNYYCQPCAKGFMNKGAHKCKSKCRYCFNENPCRETTRIDCKDCNRFFLSDQCYMNHKEITKVCNSYRYCKKCYKTYIGKSHYCGKKYCKNCEKVVPISNHECYMSPLVKSKLQDQDNMPKIFIFYDFESFQISCENGTYLHKPNLCICKIVCTLCWNSEKKDRILQYCDFCTANDQCFYGFNAVENFVTFIFKTYGGLMDEKRKNLKLKKPIQINLVAHNSKAYDLQFILKYCIENRIIPKVIKNGLKLLSMRVSNYKFIDSLNFLPMPLKTLPKTFGLENEISKGEFPHLFNKPENMFYIGNYPSIEFYQPDLKTENERCKLLEWHNSKKNKVFNFEKEIKKYCYSDVNILMRCIMIFRDDWIETSGLDCFSRCITLPQAVMEDFLTNYCKPNQIAIIPQNGYDSKRKQSYMGHAWLDYMQNSREFKIIREYKIGRYIVDGFIPETREVFEFNGCIFHGCIKCYPTKRHIILNPFSGDSVQHLFEKTNIKENYFRNENFKLTVLWECELLLMRKNCKSIDDFFNNHIKKFNQRKYIPPLEPRNAFYGGRTNASKLYHEVGPNEGIDLLDFNSLYPTVLKNESYPIVHPEI